MALQTIPPVDIEIDIPDLVVNGISLKRKAKLFTLTYNQPAKSLTLTWMVHYTDVAGAKGITPYSKQSVADNTTMVDVATGAILPPIITDVPQLDEQGQPVLDVEGNPVTTQETSYEGDYVGQYDWFNHIAETQPLYVHGLIRQYGLQADWS